MIGSRREWATGARSVYRQHANFAVHDDKDLGALVVPAELEPQVLVFERTRP